MSKIIRLMPGLTFFLLIMLLLMPVSAAANLTLSEGTPNPSGAFSKLYILDGDVLSGPVDRISPAPGVHLPPARKFVGPAQVQLYHFNDLHNFLTIPNAKKGDTHYLAQMVKLVNSARQNAGPKDPVLFFSAGDDHTGSIFDELLGQNEATFTIDPAYRAYSAAGIDAVVLGNHEFDRGTALLAKGIATAAHFPVLSANIYGSQYLNSRHYYPAVIGIAKGVRIGIIGLTTSSDTHTQMNDDPQFKIASPVKTLRNLLPAVAKLTDIVIVLSHVGYEPKESGQTLFHGESDYELAEAVSQLTSKPVFIIGGHSHTALNQAKLETTVAGTPIVQAGQRGQFLGELRFTLKNDAKITKTENITAKLYPLKKRDDTVATTDPKFDQLEHDQDYDRNFENTVISPILKTLAVKLNERIGVVADLPEIGMQRTLTDRYCGECALGNFMNEAVVARSRQFPGLENKGIDFAVFNASGINSGVPTAGTLTFNDWYAVMPFADTIQIATMTGNQIKEMVINNAKRIVRPEELTGPTPLNLSAYFSRGFLHFSKGIRYEIKLGANARETTAINIWLKEQPIDRVLNQTFVVAFNSFVGEGAYNEAWNGNPVGANISGNIMGYDLRSISKYDTGLVYRNEVVAYIREQGAIDHNSGAVLDGRVKIIP